MSKDDLWSDPEWLAFEESVMKGMVPNLKDSSINVSLCPSDEGDPKFWVELGASIMFGKPIVVVVRPGQHVPEGLRKVAESVMIVDTDDEESRAHFAEYLTGFLKGRGIE